ncbi:MAG: homospermidine biosynthesis protein [Candidatus Sumerlaeaceae bacterium]
MRKNLLVGRRIDPPPIRSDMGVAELVDEVFLAFNAARLREAAQLLARKCLDNDVTVGLTLSGALTPAGLGASALVPLLEAGFVDWIVSTGANLYHDCHFVLDCELHVGSANVNDVLLREQGLVRIYDILFEAEVLLRTDEFFRRVLDAPEFQKKMGTAEFHYLLGKYVAERESQLGQKRRSLLAAAFEFGVPVYTSSPGDSSIGLILAEKQLDGSELTLDPFLDVNETTAIVLNAKRNGGRSAVWILGGGAPKNFALQTEPQLQDVLKIGEKGHDYFIQITDARPDTGGLSGATPSEAVSWGKIDPDSLPDAVVCYCDTTIALPLLTAYLLKQHPPRQHKRLYDRRGEMLDQLRAEFHAAKRRIMTSRAR